MLDALEANGQVAYRYAPGQNPNGSARDIAGVRNEAGNVLGLMPHPEHAVDPLTGSTDGLRVFEAVAAAGVAGVTVEVAKHRELGLTDSEFELISRSSAASPTTSSWRCSACSGPSTAPTSTRASCCGGCRPRASGW